MTPTFEILIDIRLTDDQSLLVTGYHHATDAEGFNDGWWEGPEFHLDYGGVRCPIGKWHALDLAAAELSAVDVEDAETEIDRLAAEQAAAKWADARSAA